MSIVAISETAAPAWAQAPAKPEQKAPPAAKKQPLDINSASAAELKVVRGIGEADAKNGRYHPYWPVCRISLDRLEIEGQDAALTRRARGRNLFQSSAIGCSGEVVNAPGSWRVRRPR
jgi:hypothetical protein